MFGHHVRPYGEIGRTISKFGRTMSDDRVLFPALSFCLFFALFSNKADEEVLVMEVPLRDDSVDNLESETWHLSPEPLDTDEMVSYTENARINAWKTPEVIKKASNSGVPSRVGSATTRVNANPSTPPPPQRPSSPTHPGAIPFKQADRWLAGGRDINSTSVKHVSVPLPGWMDGLDTVRRPKSSPAVRGTR